MTKEEVIQFLYQIADEIQSFLDKSQFPKRERTFQKRLEALSAAISSLRAQQEQCGLTNEQLGRVIKNSYIEGYEDCKAGKPPLEKRSNDPIRCGLQNIPKQRKDDVDHYSSR